MSNIDYKNIYEDTLFDKISIQKEFEQYKILQADIVNIQLKILKIKTI